LAVKEAQSGLPGVLNVAVRFTAGEATIRYLPEKISLEQILKQYDNTPFEVVADGPIVTIAHTGQWTFRGWTSRPEPDQPASKDNPSNDPAENDRQIPLPILLIVEVLPADDARTASPVQLTLSDPPAAGLEMEDDFHRVKSPAKTDENQTDRPNDKLRPVRWVARLVESVALKPGEIVIPVSFPLKTVNDSKQQETTGRLGVILRTAATKQQTDSAASSGLALVGGALELRLGHLCDQSGCVEHFHKSLAEIDGLGAVRPHPSSQDPRATVYLRAERAVDVWRLREELRDRGAEITKIKPQNLPSYRLRVELPRWRTADEAGDAEQFTNLRSRAVKIIQQLGWAKNVLAAGGGINFESTRPAVDLVELLDAFSVHGMAPQAVWLVPTGVSMPKTAPPQLAGPRVVPKQGGSQIHPLVEFNFPHSSDVGTHILSLLGEQKWASLTRFELGATDVARLAIADRKYANLTPLLHKFRASGRIPAQIQLREFGDVHIQIEFSHICGDVEYSKPKRKKEKDLDKPKSQPKKPLVPKALRPASTSNGRRTIEAAVASIGWIKDSIFHDYHTKPHFSGPRKLTISLQANGDDVIELEQLIDALHAAGFPPKSVIVSRRFPGIPFAKRLPGDLQLTDRDGNILRLAVLKKSDRPLALAFVSLKCPRYKKYTADPKYYQSLKETIDQYQDRIDFWAVSANPEDKFSDVQQFWSKTAVASVPLLHDADGTLRDAFNSQVTPAPHLFVFDADGRLRYAGEAHDNWEADDKAKDPFLGSALELVLAGKYQSNGAVFYNKSVCNCSHPTCKCPKCGCGATCRCGIKHCSVGF
jgi:hypothetical protein